MLVIPEANACDMGIRSDPVDDRRFNGATAWEPWRQLAVIFIGTVATGFNGATAWEPWRR